MIESVDLIIRQAGHPERVVKLHEGVTRLGRAEDNDVVLSDVGVSRRHSRIMINHDAVRVEDLGSGNGTYYRGFRVQNQQVEDGDELVVDPFVLQFRIKGGPSRAQVVPTDTGPVGARLDVVVGAGLARSSYPITSRGLTIGRSETRDVVIADPAASRHHCSVLYRDGVWSLRDMGSANGIFVNGIRARESLLADGDRFRIGNTELRFVLGGDLAMADSDTNRTPRQTWANPGTATEPEIILGRPLDAPTPNAREPRTGGMGAGSMIAGGIGIVAAVGLLALAVLVVLAAGVLLYQRQQAASTQTPNGRPLAWALTLPGGLAPVDIDTLQKQGISALQSGDNKTALQDFYRILQTEAGTASAERLAFAAGEYVILDSLQTELEASTKTRLAREQRRTELLADATSGGSRRKPAVEALVKDFRDDSVVNSTLAWTPSEASKQLSRDLADAAVAQDDSQWARAVELYTKVLPKVSDPIQRKTAYAGVEACRRELARDVAADWRAAVLASANGDTSTAKAKWDAVIKVDPTNPSARIRTATP